MCSFSKASGTAAQDNFLQDRQDEQDKVHDCGHARDTNTVFSENGSLVQCVIDTFMFSLYNKVITNEDMMRLSKQPDHFHENALRLTLDARKRVSLAKLLPGWEISSFKAYTEEGKIILEPMAEIPANELWLYKNPSAYESVQRGLDQAKKGKVKKLNRDFSKFVDD